MNGVRRAFTGERAWHDCRREARALREALFPEARKNENGFLISFDADEDLAAALYDLKRLNADKVCIRTNREGARPSANGAFDLTGKLMFDTSGDHKT